MHLAHAAKSVIRQAPVESCPAAWRAASVSAALHGSVLAVLCMLVAPRHLPPEPPSFAMVMAPPPEDALQATRLQPMPQASPPLLAPTPLSLAPSPPALHATHRMTHPVQRQARAAPPAQTPAAAQAPAPPASPQAAVPHDMLAGLEARIREAVQDAALYPTSARIMHLEGRIQVRFDYTDGSADAARVASSSNSPMLDRAALAAVRAASLPRAPAEIGGRRLPLLIWVEFRLVRQD